MNFNEVKDVRVTNHIERDQVDQNNSNARWFRETFEREGEMFVCTFTSSDAGCCPCCGSFDHSNCDAKLRISEEDLEDYVNRCSRMIDVEVIIGGE